MEKFPITVPKVTSQWGEGFQIQPYEFHPCETNPAFPEGASSKTKCKGLQGNVTLGWHFPFKIASVNLLQMFLYLICELHKPQRLGIPPLSTTRSCSNKSYHLTYFIPHVATELLMLKSKHPFRVFFATVLHFTQLPPAKCIIKMKHL